MAADKDRGRASPGLVWCPSAFLISLKVTPVPVVPWLVGSFCNGFMKGDFHGLHLNKIHDNFFHFFKCHLKCDQKILKISIYRENVIFINFQTER